jgi:hypothetical protein
MAQPGTRQPSGNSLGRILSQALPPRRCLRPRGRRRTSRSRLEYDADPGLSRGWRSTTCATAIFQRMRDITRRGGSQAYQRAVNGLNLGVDLRGNTMNGFLGIKVLTELLIMGRVGVYVDSPAWCRATRPWRTVRELSALPLLLPYRRHPELDVRQAGRALHVPGDLAPRRGAQLRSADLLADDDRRALPHVVDRPRHGLGQLAIPGHRGNPSTATGIPPGPWSWS